PHHFNAESELIESLLNQDTLIISSLRIDSLLDEFSGELAHIDLIPPGINEADVDPEEDIRLIERLLYDNSSHRPSKEFNSENFDAVIESFSPSPIPVEDSDFLMEEIDLFLTPDDSMPPGIENDDYDSEGDILFLEELLSNDSCWELCIPDLVPLVILLSTASYLEEELAPTTGETSAPPAPKTAKQLAAIRNQERVKSILLLAIPDEYRSSVSQCSDAKSLWKQSNQGLERNKPDIDEIDIDDLYNNLRVYEDEMKRSLSSTSNSYNLLTPPLRILTVLMKLVLPVEILGPQLENEDFQQIDGDDLEELDLRWQVAMLTVRVKKFIQRTGRNMDFKEKRPVSLDKSGRNQGRRSYGDNGRSNAPTNEFSSQTLVAQDGLGGYDWSNDFKVEPVNYALMAISSSSSSSSSDSEVQKCSKQCLESFKTLQKNYDTEREKHNKAKLEIRGYEIALESLESRILGHEKEMNMAWKVDKEKDDLKLKIEKWEESSKNLDEILNSQMSVRDKTDYEDFIEDLRWLLEVDPKEGNTGKGLENQLNHNVKIIRCDNRLEFKNHAMNEFVARKGIKREFSVARTPQQNGVAERKNRTLIEAARAMLADLLLLSYFGQRR
ncbi:uncharacterized mitochondrial protein-like protein, partial [Tanacetum coccineum]